MNDNYQRIYYPERTSHKKKKKKKEGSVGDTQYTHINVIFFQCV